MGTNTLTTAVDGTVIPATDNNQFKTALSQDFVPRNASGAPATSGGSLGSTLYKWLDAYIANNAYINNDATIDRDLTVSRYAYILQAFFGTGANNNYVKENGTSLEFYGNNTLVATLSSSGWVFAAGKYTVTSAQLPGGIIDASKLASNAVEEAKILNSAVTENKLATDAVTTNKISALSVTDAKIANATITPSKSVEKWYTVDISGNTTSYASEKTIGSLAVAPTLNASNHVIVSLCMKEGAYNVATLGNTIGGTTIEYRIRRDTALTGSIIWAAQVAGGSTLDVRNVTLRVASGDAFYISAIAIVGSPDADITNVRFNKEYA